MKGVHCSHRQARTVGHVAFLIWNLPVTWFSEASNMFNTPHSTIDFDDSGHACHFSLMCNVRSSCYQHHLHFGRLMGDHIEMPEEGPSTRSFVCPHCAKPAVATRCGSAEHMPLDEDGDPEGYDLLYVMEQCGACGEVSPQVAT